ncbi:MAG TPA: TIGR03435 family protein [Bryobacteraceae bacterium]|nr:TIGR03435 family protein [Bryobacteraceae bacterium]
MGKICAVAMLTLVCGAAVAADAARTFEVADVHPAEPDSVWTLSAMREPVLSARAGQIRGGRYEIHSATLVDLIAVAWSVDPVRLIGGPPWLDIARFDIVAKVPAGATAADLPLMLQSLLVDRFHLSTHPDTRPFPEVVLIAGPHVLLKTPEGGAESGCKRSALPGEAGLVCRDVTMAQFTQALPQVAGDYFQGNRLLDQTQLRGAFDFSFHWTRRSKFAAAGAGGISLASAVEKQLGLKLAMRDVPAAVLVVDRVERAPTTNAPAVAQLLPSEPLAFEVAVIKPTPPGVAKNVRIGPSGRVEIEGVTLKSLIKLAWDIEDLDAIDNEELLIGAPGFSESVRYDIVARPPATGPADLDSLKLMLRALLADRFGLKTHVETRPVPVLALVASKPRLQRAEPRGRSGCRNTPVALQSGLAFVPVFSVRCRNTTMAQLASKLQAFGGPYIPHAAIDATGLVGAFDFTFQWSPPHLVDNSTSDPNGSITLVEALDRQLGIRIRPEKAPMPVIVVDQVNPTPTPN